MIFFIWRMNSRWTQIHPIYKTVPNLNQHSGYNNVPMIKTNHAFLLVFFVKEKCYYNLFRYLNEHIYIEKRVIVVVVLVIVGTTLLLNPILIHSSLPAKKLIILIWKPLKSCIQLCLRVQNVRHILNQVNRNIPFLRNVSSKKRSLVSRNRLGENVFITHPPAQSNVYENIFNFKNQANKQKNKNRKKQKKLKAKREYLQKIN